MKGVLTLEQEIKMARTRVIKLCDAGRLGDDPHALKLAKQVATMLRTAGLLSTSLRKYEVGREIHDNDTRPAGVCEQTEHSTDRL